jgi:hypothetical protein
MAQLRRVAPGDLITAELFNLMLEEIDKLKQQVVVSSTQDDVIISNLIPPSGTLQLGQELQVLGRNFRFTAGGLKVYLDDLPITTFNSATDEKLVFMVPTTISVPTGGKASILTVNNDRTSAQRTLTLLPAITLSGSASVVLQGTSPTTPVAGSPFTLEFRLVSRASVDTTFTIDAQVKVATRQTEWQNNVRVLNQGHTDISSRQLAVGAGQQATFFVVLSPIPAGTDNTAFSVTVNVASGNVQGSSGAQAFTVGTVAPQPDPAITSFNFAAFELDAPGDGTVTPTSIGLKAGKTATISLTTTLTAVASYSLNGRLASGSNWTITRVNETTPPTLAIGDSDLRIGGVARKTVQFNVTAAAGASATGQVEFSISRSGQTPRLYPMELRLLPA